MYPTLGKGQQALPENEGPSPGLWWLTIWLKIQKTLEVHGGSCRAQAVSRGGNSLKCWQKWGKENYVKGPRACQ